MSTSPDSPFSLALLRTSAQSEDGPRQVLFLAYLAQHGIRTRAMRQARVSLDDLEEWLSGPPEGFPRFYRLALDMAADDLEAVAHERATVGVSVPVFGRTGIIGERQERSDRLLVELLRARRPSAFKDRLATPILDAAGRREAFEQQLHRLRARPQPEPEPQPAGRASGAPRGAHTSASPPPPGEAAPPAGEPPAPPPPSRAGGPPSRAQGLRAQGQDQGQGAQGGGAAQEEQPQDEGPRRQGEG